MHIYVLDLETTGLQGYPKDKVVQIGVVSLDLVTGEIETEMDEYLGYELTEEEKQSWIFTEGGLDPDSLRDARSPEEIAHDLRLMLRDQRVAIFNVGFDYTKFLAHPPFDLMPDDLVILPCVMQQARWVTRIKNRWDRYKWPTLHQAVELVLGETQSHEHSAVDDAWWTARLLHRMITYFDMGNYHQYIDRYTLIEKGVLDPDIDPWSEVQEISYEEYWERWGQYRQGYSESEEEERYVATGWRGIDAPDGNGVKCPKCGADGEIRIEILNIIHYVCPDCKIAYNRREYSSLAMLGIVIEG